MSDLTKSTDTLLRSHKQDTVIWEESQEVARESVVTNTRHKNIISSRSQSMSEIAGVKTPGAAKKHVTHHQAAPELGSQGRSRSSNTIGSSSSARNSLVNNNTVLEARRRSTISKLKGLVIPEMVSETSNTTNHNGAKEKPADNEKQGTVSSNKLSASGSLPNPPWKDKSLTEDYPKYSPAFKRKPFTVYSNSSKKSDTDQPSPARSQSKLTTVSKKSSGDHETGSSGLKTEDSDNDSAVSSGRSSLSCRSCSPPQSPKNHQKHQEVNHRVLKKNSVEAINRQNVINACKKSSPTEPPLDTSSPRTTPRTVSKPASRSSSFTIAERKKSFESQHSSADSSRRGSSTSHDSVSRKSSRETSSQDDRQSRRSSSVNNNNNRSYPDSIIDLEEKVAFMSEVVDRAASVTPTERRSLSRTPSLASERSYSSRSSRNSSIVSEKTPFNRNNSILSKDSAISEDISKEVEEKSNGSDKKWSDLEKKYSRGLSSGSIGDTISKLSKSSDDAKHERPKDLMIAQKKLTNGAKSPSSKNFKELAEKWQTMSHPETPVTPVNPVTTTLPRKHSRDKTITDQEKPVTATLPRRSSKDKEVTPTNGSSKTLDHSADNNNLQSSSTPSWSSPPAASKGETSVVFEIIMLKYFLDSYYQVNGGETDWSGFDKCDLPDRKYSVPSFNENTVKLRDRKDNLPSRPSSLIESSEQKDLKIFEIGNLGDSGRLLDSISGCTSQSSSQADLLDSTSVTSDTPKSPLPSSSSREILDVFSNRLVKIISDKDNTTLL